MASFRTIGYQTSPQPMMPVENNDNYSQLAKIFAAAMQGGANIADAAAQQAAYSQQQADQLAREKVAEGKFRLAAQNAEEELRLQGYRMEGDEASRRAQEAQQGIQEFKDAEQYQMDDLDRLIGENEGNLRKVLVNNPGLLPGPRKEIQRQLADQISAVDLGEFDAAVMRNPTADIDQLFNEFVRDPNRQSRFQDDYEKGVWLSSMAKGLARQKNVRLVQQAEKDRLDAIGASYDNLRRNLGSAASLKAFSPEFVQNQIDNYVNSVGSIDNQRSEAELRTAGLDAVKTSLLSLSDQDPYGAMEQFNAVFNSDKFKSDPIIAMALKGDLETKIKSFESSIVNQAKTAISGDQSLSGRMLFKQSIEQDTKLSNSAKAELQNAVISSNDSMIKDRIANADSRDALQRTMADAQTLVQSGGLTKASFEGHQAEAKKKFEALQNRSDVEDVLSRKDGWDLINLTEKHDEWIDKWADNQLQGGKPLSEVYVDTLMNFRKLTPRQIQNINGLVRNAVVTTGDPVADQKRFEQASEAASIFDRISRVAPAYVDDLLLNKDKGGLSPKVQAIATGIRYLGMTPENVLLDIAQAPASVFDDAARVKADPNKGIPDQTTAIREAFTNYRWWRPGSADMYLSGPSPEGVSPQAQKFFRGLFLYEYGKAAIARPQSTPEELAKQAIEDAKVSMANNSFAVDLGDFNTVVLPSLSPLNKDQTVVMSQVWDKTLRQAERKFEQLRYGNTTLDMDKPSLSKDGKTWDYPVYRTDIGRQRPYAIFKYPADEMEQKKLADALAVRGFRTEDERRKFAEEKDRIFNSMFVPISEVK